MIREGRYSPGKLCKDCMSNHALTDEWEWYKIVQMSRTVAWIPVVMSGIIVAMTIAGKMSWYLGLFNLAVMAYAWWTHKKRDYPRRLSESREKMFLVKVQGKDPNYRTECP